MQFGTSFDRSGGKGKVRCWQGLVYHTSPIRSLSSPLELRVPAVYAPISGEKMEDETVIWVTKIG